MKKITLILSLFVVACSKPVTNTDRAIQSAQAYLKDADNKNIEYSKLDSVIDYQDDVLRQIAEAQRQLLIAHDSLKYKQLFDSLQAAPKIKYYIINYSNKTTSASTWQMLVMDTAFKVIKAHNPDGSTDINSNNSSK
jgi:hypothetical protein